MKNYCIATVALTLSILFQLPASATEAKVAGETSELSNKVANMAICNAYYEHILERQAGDVLDNMIAELAIEIILNKAETIGVDKERIHSLGDTIRKSFSTTDNEFLDNTFSEQCEDMVSSL